MFSWLGCSELKVQLCLSMAEEVALDEHKMARPFLQKTCLVFGLTLGEFSTVDEATCNYWRLTKLKDLLREYSPRDIYHVNKTTIFLSDAPTENIALAGDSCTGAKHSKVRIIDLVGTNTIRTDKLKQASRSLHLASRMSKRFR